MSTADGNQGHAMTAEAFVQVYIPALELVIHWNGPAGTDTEETVQGGAL